MRLINLGMAAFLDAQFGNMFNNEDGQPLSCKIRKPLLAEYSTAPLLVMSTRLDVSIVR
jgi:hypothetical protein